MTLGGKFALVGIAVATVALIPQAIILTRQSREAAASVAESSRRLAEAALDSAAASAEALCEMAQSAAEKHREPRLTAFEFPRLALFQPRFATPAPMPFFPTLPEPSPLDQARLAIEDLRIGKTGYIYVSNHGQYVIPPRNSAGPLKPRIERT